MAALRGRAPAGQLRDWPCELCVRSLELRLQVIEVTPSEGLVVFSDRSQHGSVVIRRTGERLHVKGRTSGAGDPTGSLLLFEGDQIVLGGVTLLLEKLTPSSLKEEEIEEEAAAVVAGFGGAAAPHAVTDGVATGAGVTGPRGPDSSTL